MPRAALPLLCVALLAWVTTAPAQGPTVANHRYRLPAGQDAAVACHMADLDGDGRADLIRATANSFGVWLQDGAGAFQPVAVPILVPTGNPEIVTITTARVATGKFPDLVVGYRDATVHVYPNAGGKFAAPWVLPPVVVAAPALEQVVTGSLDTDPTYDELVLVLNQQWPVLYSRVGVAQFQQTTLNSGPQLRTPRAVLVDLDNDTDLDLLLVTGDATPTAPALYLNNSGRGFTLDQLAFGRMQVNASVLRAADVNGNGRMELLLGPLAQAASAIRIVQNTSATPTTLQYALLNITSAFLTVAPRGLAFGDLNGDSYPDVVAMNDDGSVGYGLNAGAAAPGRFGPMKVLLDAAPRAAMALVDLEPDGDLDLYVAGAGTEDRLLLGGSSTDPILELDTEVLAMPSAVVDEYLLGVVDVSGEGDPDLVLWSTSGVPTYLRNDAGQARFVTTSPIGVIPTLPSSTYQSAHNAAITRKHTAADLVVLGAVSAQNPTGVRVIVQTGRGVLADDTATRWLFTGSLRSLATGDVSGSVPGSTGTVGLSDVVGVDGAGQLWLIVNVAGVFSKAVSMSSTAVQNGARLHIGDINLDGHADVVVAQPTQGVRVLLADPTAPDKFLEVPPQLWGGIASTLEDLDGDLIPDLLVVTNSVAQRVLLLQGTTAGRFVDRTAAWLPTQGALPPVDSIAVLRSSYGRHPSLVLGCPRNRDWIARMNTSGVFGTPEPLPVRGSILTRRLAVADLDLDGDDDLVVARFDALPAVLLGQSVQLSNVGITQAGRESSIRVALPGSQWLGAIAIGFPTARVEIPGLGVIRLQRILPTMLPVPSAQVSVLRFPMPANLGTTPIPLQLLTVAPNGKLTFHNLDVFQATRR